MESLPSAGSYGAMFLLLLILRDLTDGSADGVGATRSEKVFVCIVKPET